MIKVGIIGCDHHRAAELVRLLINHPDVELRWVMDAGKAGQRLDVLVNGIVGECDLVVEPEGPLGDIDVVYLCGGRADAVKQMSAMVLPDDLRVIDLSGSHNRDHGPDKPWAYGMGEMQRRVLVHEARLVTVPGNAAAASLLAVLPMARNLMLNSPITLHVAIGQSTLPPEGHTLDGMTAEQWALDQQQEVEYVLRQCQNSFCQPVSLSVTRLAERRTLAVAAQFKCGVAAEMIAQLYEQYYDDHNFVFIVNRPLVTADIENTNKCLIRLDKDESSGLLTIHAVMDVLLKGCAGNAVHAMNLMFGLHERVGLTLKGTGC